MIKFGLIWCVFLGFVWWLVLDGIEILEWSYCNKCYIMYIFMNFLIYDNNYIYKLF